MLKDAQWTRLLPVLERGWRPLLPAAFPEVGFLSEGAMALMILPNLRSGSNIRGALLSAATASLALSLISGLLGSVVLGAEAAKATFPLFDMGRLISIADFIERIDPLIIALWMGGAFVKLAVFTYTGGVSLARGVGLATPSHTFLPLTALALVWSMREWVSVQNHLHWIKVIAFPFVGLIGIAIPSMLLGGALLTGAGSPRRVHGAGRSSRP